MSGRRTLHSPAGRRVGAAGVVRRGVAGVLVAVVLGACIGAIEADELADEVRDRSARLPGLAVAGVADELGRDDLELRSVVFRLDDRTVDVVLSDPSAAGDLLGYRYDGTDLRPAVLDEDAHGDGAGPPDPFSLGDAPALEQPAALEAGVAELLGEEVRLVRLTAARPAGEDVEIVASVRGGPSVPRFVFDGAGNYLRTERA